jgi:hypothetical protein
MGIIPEKYFHRKMPMSYQIIYYVFFNTIDEKWGSFRAVNNENRLVYVPCCVFRITGYGFEIGWIPFFHS